MITRHLKNQTINKLIAPNRVLIVYGPRRVGKTTVLSHYAKTQTNKKRVFFETGEDSTLQRILTSQSVSKIKAFFNEYDLVIIDEAQYVPNVGQSLKLLVDQVSNIQVIASGSSSFDLANQIGEPLTGRKKTFTLFPVSTLEYINNFGPIAIEQNLEQFLRYGSYPEALTLDSEKKKADYLDELVDSYLYKDVLKFKQLKNSDIINKLLRLIAFQIGQEVSLNELGNSLDVSKQTVNSYLTLLEKSFVIFKVRGFSRNLRKEVTKMCRYYFYDNGVLNSILHNYNSLELRKDVGQLWENFLFAERMKFRFYTGIRANQYFWRTWDQQEIDLVEERDGGLFGYEFKWGSKQPAAPTEWKKTYPQAIYRVINRTNYLEFLT